MTRADSPPDSNQTVLLSPKDQHSMPTEPAVEITCSPPGGGQKTLRFTSAFRVGRGQDCAVRIADPSVSRHHLEIYWDEGWWWAHDLQSQNGTFLNGEPIREHSQKVGLSSRWQNGEKG